MAGAESLSSEWEPVPQEQMWPYMEEEYDCHSTRLLAKVSRFWQWEEEVQFV